MGRDKQIEELAKDIYSLTRVNGLSRALATLLHEKGYCKAPEVAEEIFGELLIEVDKAIDFTADSRRIRFELCQQKDIDPYKDRQFNVFDGKYNCMLGAGKFIAELKKKYTESEDTE